MFDTLIEFIKSLYPGMNEIPLHAPVLNDADREGVLEAINCGFVSSVGPHVVKFEDMLAQTTGASKVVAVVNGTAALHMAMLVCNVRQNDYVITQALTFVATANAIKYIGADPIFLDSDFDTLGLSPVALETFLDKNAYRKNDGAYLKLNDRKISACVPMHVFGHPVRIFEIIEICKKWNIAVIEDAAESLGSEIDGQSTGCIADVGILSFNGNKVITTGGGGALLFKDPTLAQRARHLSTTAKIPHPWKFFHDEVGYNYRMPNLNAALGCAQLKRLPEFLDAKKIIASKYSSFFESNKEVIFVKDRFGTKPNWWLNAILVKDLKSRDLLLKNLNDKGIMVRPAWELMINLPMYADCIHDDLTVCRNLSGKLINLPSGVFQ
jgi:perosamine synthetase